LRIVVRSEEGEGRGERAGADAGHQIEGRARALRAPAAQQAGAESTVLAAARDGEKLELRHVGE
jgi:hypothetical protein